VNSRYALDTDVSARLDHVCTDFGSCRTRGLGLIFQIGMTHARLKVCIYEFILFCTYKYLLSTK